jgi:peptidoglycan/xylan/chitin deacetylase (PgdA/CDA1 family)
MRFGRRIRHSLPTSTSAAPGRPVVSVTFDDGLASQRRAAELLEARGLHATFYVSSGLVGEPDRLGWGDIVRLAARGHEIGGHTVSHAALSEIPLERARHEIVSDREALTAHGLEPVSFAYPYGKSTAETEDLVRHAGYLAGRGIGGVVETLPPGNAYRLRAPHSARAWTTAEQLAGLVLAAEHEEGWLIATFHHLGRDRRSNYTTPEREFSAFLDWLVERKVPVMPVRNVVSDGV